MPSGPEGVQEISEHTLMHPKHTNDWILFLSRFLPLIIIIIIFCLMVLLVVEPGCFGFFFIFRRTQTHNHVSNTLPPFVLLFIALLYIELVFTDIYGVLGVLKWAGISYIQKIQKLLSKTKCVFHQ